MKKVRGKGRSSVENRWSSAESPTSRTAKSDRDALACWPEADFPFTDADWDFTFVKEDQLAAVIFYEYARSCDWLIESVRRWHSHMIQVPSELCDEGWPATISVWDVIRRADESDAIQPPEVVSLLNNSMPPELATPAFQDAWQIGLTFPAPFKWLRSPDIKGFFWDLDAAAPAFWERKEGCLPWPKSRLLTMLDEPSGDISLLREFRVVIDTRFGEAKIKKDAAKWLSSLRLPERTIGAKGRAAACPWHVLKQLAAYRLRHQLALPLEGIGPHVARRLEKIGGNRELDRILPTYFAASDALRAVKCAEERLKALFPKP